MEVVGLILYGLFVAAGILGVVLLLKKLGQGETLPLDPQGARTLFADRFPDLTIMEEKGLPHAVFFTLEAGGLGLVRMEGHRPVARHLEGADIKGIRAVPGAVILDLSDFADPHVRVATDEPEALQGWVARCFRSG